MVRCEPDTDTCVLHPKAQKPTIIYHIAIPRLINFVFFGKSDVPFKYLKFHTGSANPFIILSSNYGSFQETEQIPFVRTARNSASLEMAQERFFNGILGVIS